MSTDTDLLMERRRRRRQSLVWKVLAVVALTALLAVLVAGDPAKMVGAGAKRSLLDGERIARVEVTGLIVEDRWRREMIQELVEDDQVKAVLVVVNSPGGTVVGGETLYNGLRDLAEAKPVVAVMGSTATSAAYMTAIAADRIFAHEGTLTGSIGVIMQTANVNDLLDKLGVKPETIKSGPLKAQPNPLEPLDEDARAHIRAVVMDMHAMFVDMVAERRGFSRTQAKSLADGRVFTGRQAVRRDLIDAIGGEDDAKAWLVETHDLDADLPLVDAEPDYPQSGWVRRMLGDAGGALGKALLSERVTLDGLLSVWHPEL